ncbi:oligosaccharide flippase family protein [Paraglaciecola aestuariivivens]
MLTSKGLLASSAFSSGAKFLSRIIGLVSTLLLARILTPSDFAMIAIIAIVLHLFDILSHSGAEQYIVQKTQVSDDDLNTAWSLDLVLKSLMCLLLWGLAPFIAGFFTQAQLSLAIQVAAFALIINALKNPGLLLLKRALEYKKLFYLSLWQRLASFITVLAVALYWQSFWAFVIADLVGAVVYSLGAYLVQSYRPRFSLVNVSQQWLFSKWLLGKSIVGYLRSQVDTVLVAKFFTPTQLGNYHMARDVAMLPGHNLLGPAIEPLLADFKDYQKHTQQLGQRISKVLYIVALVVIPITLFMVYYPALIIEVLLGEQWQIAGDILAIMAWLFFYYCFLLVIESALTAIGKVKAIFMFDLVSLVAIVALLLSYLQQNNDLHTLLWLRVAIGIGSTFCITLFLHQFAPLSLLKIIGMMLVALVFALLAIALTQSLMAILTLGAISEFLLAGSVFVAGYLVLVWGFVTLGLGLSIKELSKQLGVKNLA